MMSSSLDIITTEDEQFKEHYPSIMKKIETKKLMEMEPTLDEITKVYSIIIDYIKSNKRKVYGGYGLNKLLIAKNPGYAIYDELDTPDIEFYSPDPMGDLIKLCDILHENKFKTVMGQEAQHKETYSLFVNFQLYCDISYMPSNIYNKARFIQVDGFNIIHPWFMTIDYFRMFTDPMISYWRLEKHLARYLKLQKTYPLPIISKQLNLEQYQNKNISKSIDIIGDYLSRLSSIIFTGFYTYNYYLTHSKYAEKDSKFKPIHIPYLEVYSTNYVEDGLGLVKFISELPDELKSKIIYKEFYPFFQFYGYNTVFYYVDGDEEIPILYLYSNNKKCIPYKQVPNILSKSSNKSDTLNIGSFDFNILHALIILVKIRVDDDNDWNDILYTMINGMVTFRKYYFQQNKITLYENSIYEGFVIECKGETIPPDREKRLLIQVRKKLGKPGVYKYEAGVSKHPGQYYFMNSSGNIVRNKANLKLIESNLGKGIEDEIELEESSNDLTKEKTLNDDENKTDTDIKDQNKIGGNEKLELKQNQISNTNLDVDLDLDLDLESDIFTNDDKN